MWILDDLGFCGCATSLYVRTVIFRKEILTEKET